MFIYSTLKLFTMFQGYPCLIKICIVQLWEALLNMTMTVQEKISGKQCVLFL